MCIGYITNECEVAKLKWLRETSLLLLFITIKRVKIVYKYLHNLSVFINKYQMINKTLASNIWFSYKVKLICNFV